MARQAVRACIEQESRADEATLRRHLYKLQLRDTTAWAVGARGEELLGARLNSLVEEGIQVLHDRRIPGSKANIDHIAVAASGVYVIDAKRYKGGPRLRVDRGLFRPRPVSSASSRPTGR